MSKRSGNFVTLADVVREVGKDVVRFTMLTRKAEAQMDFDFAKVVEASKDNPVFYVQYAHARVRSTLRKAAAEGLGAVRCRARPAGRRGTRRWSARRAVPADGRGGGRGARAAPHRVFPLRSRRGVPRLWNLGNDRPDKRFIVADDAELTGARLFLASQIGQIVRNGLAILGVAAAEEM